MLIIRLRFSHQNITSILVFMMLYAWSSLALGNQIAREGKLASCQMFGMTLHQKCELVLSDPTKCAGLKAVYVACLHVLNKEEILNDKSEFSALDPDPAYADELDPFSPCGYLIARLILADICNK